MGHSFSYTIKSEGESDAHVNGEFTDDEFETLTQYVEQWDSLEQCRPIRDGFFEGFTFTFGDTSGESDGSPDVDREVLSILLHELRPFVLQNEPASFNAVAGIVGRRVESLPIRGFMRDIRELYDGRNSQRLYTLSIDDTVVNSEKALQQWLNGREYHRDPDKSEVVDKLFEAIGEKATVSIFLSLLDDKVRAISALAQLASMLVGRRKSLSVRFRSSTV